MIAETTRRVALVGNPNTGKTTVFNRLTGFHARVGNYAGVTVERKSGPVRGTVAPVELIDLPGTYSLTASSPDELVAVEVLLGRRAEDPRPPDAVLLVADASNLERNLFLTSQVLETGLACALILNMTDVAQEHGITMEPDALATRLGIPVFPVMANRGEGLDKVMLWLDAGCPVEAVESRWQAEFPPAFEDAVQKTVELCRRLTPAVSPAIPEFLIRRLLQENQGAAEESVVRSLGPEVAEGIGAIRAEMEAAGVRTAGLEPRVRYGSIRTLLDGIHERPTEPLETLSDRMDRYLLHPVWGTLGFLAMMLLVFQAIFSWSAPMMDAIDGLFGALGGWLQTQLPEGPLASFLTDGVIAGVGGVLVFLPQILLLFLFVSVLEDCGYLARAAFLADRLFSRIGLSGRSFIPLLSSFACAIPGIMATRTISDWRGRLTTIMISPLMSCSARLPVYLLMISAFVPSRKILGILELQGLVLFGMYLVGPFVAVIAALVFHGSLKRVGASAFLMELPPFRAPGVRVVVMRIVERAGAFVKKAGTLILAVSILIWAASYYPRPASIRMGIEGTYQVRIAEAASPEQVEALKLESDHAVQSAYLRNSILGRAGHLIEPIVRPLGWDWRIGMAVIASFPAREVVVATLGVIFGVGGDTDADSEELKTKLLEARRPDGGALFTLPVALSIMVFFALCAQCAATLVIIKRETNSWRWPILAFSYMTALAWVGAFLTFHGARLLGL